MQPLEYLAILFMCKECSFTTHEMQPHKRKDHFAIILMCKVCSFTEIGKAHEMQPHKSKYHFNVL